MDLAYDSSFPLRDLASCLDAGSQSGPGVSTGDEPAGTAQGENTPSSSWATLCTGEELELGVGVGVMGQWWRGDPALWTWWASLSLVGLPRPQGMGRLRGSHGCVGAERRTGDAQVSHVCLRPAAQLVGSLAVRVSDAAFCKQPKAGLTSGPSLRQQSCRICLVLSIPSVFFFFPLIYLLIFSCAGSLSLGRLFSSCGERRRLSSQGGGLLTAVASAGEQWLSGAWAPVAEARGSGCGSRDLDRRLSSGGARPHRPRHAGSSQTRD